MNFPITQQYGQPLLDTKDYDFLPVPSHINIKQGWNSNVVPNTPYSQDLRQTAARLKLTIPFTHVITTDEGHSTCVSCGARYAGSNPSGCEQKVFKIKNSQYRYEYSKRYSPENRTETCEGRCSWDLEKEFYTQQKFFSFVQELSTITSDSFDEFSDCIPVELRDAVRTKITTARLQALEMRVQNALMQISMKMNQAGSALQF